MVYVLDSWVKDKLGFAANQLLLSELILVLLLDWSQRIVGRQAGPRKFCCISLLNRIVLFKIHFF